jgi:hypothetical protein
MLRFQPRAIRRCGELLKQIGRPEQGGRPAAKNGVGSAYAIPQSPLPTEGRNIRSPRLPQSGTISLQKSSGYGR